MPNTLNTTVYETDTNAENVHAVLQAMETFAVANGWTVMKSCLADAISDIDTGFDDSSQSGAITTVSSPWSADRDGFASITGSVVSYDFDPGGGYYTRLSGYTPGDTIEVEIEVLTDLAGSLDVRYGDITSVLTLNGQRTYKVCGVMGAGGYIEFYTSDFRGQFQVISIKKRVKTLELSLYRSGVGYFHFKTLIEDTDYRIAHKGPFIYLCTSSGWTEGNAYDAHPGTSPVQCSNAIDESMHGSIFSYHFFGTAKHIYAVVEYEQSSFAHFGFGSSYKYWDYRGSNFVYGCRWLHDTYCNSNDISTNGHSYPIGYAYSRATYNNYMRADLLGSTLNSYLKDGYSGLDDWLELQITAYGWGDQMYDENAYYGTSPLSPVHFAGEDINGYSYPLGEMEEYRRVFCKYLDPKTVLSIEEGDWMIFPVRRKQLTTPAEYVPNSSNYALAFYKGPTTP